VRLEILKLLLSRHRFLGSKSKPAILIIAGILAKAVGQLSLPVLALAALALGACGAEEPLVVGDDTVGAHACPDGNGSLALTLYGQNPRTIDWRGADLRCAGMPRPDGQGVRLRFSSANPDDSLAMVLGLDTAIVGAETGANVTLILEDSGRFFSSLKADNCRARVDTYVTVSSTDPVRLLAGLAWCVGPLREVNGNSEITLGDIEFQGFVPWPALEPESTP
jgi:hypothetical protein